MKKAVGFRNLAVHNYDTIHWNVVYAIVHCHLDDFRSFAQQIGLSLLREKCSWPLDYRFQSRRQFFHWSLVTAQTGVLQYSDT